MTPQLKIRPKLVCKTFMPSIHHLHSFNKIFRLWLMTLLFCSLPVTDFDALAQVNAIDDTTKEECVIQSDGLHHCMMQKRQKMPAGFIVTAKNGERIGSSRPTRLIPTNGRMLGHLTLANSIYHSNLYALLLRHSGGGIRAWAASPRFYYVIALRRILC